MQRGEGKNGRRWAGEELNTLTRRAGETYRLPTPSQTRGGYRRDLYNIPDGRESSCACGKPRVRCACGIRSITDIIPIHRVALRAGRPLISTIQLCSQGKNRLHGASKTYLSSYDLQRCWDVGRAQVHSPELRRVTNQ